MSAQTSSWQVQQTCILESDYLVIKLKQANATD
jgi:hypothetical protein